MLIDGRKIADEILEGLKRGIEKSGRHFKLAAVLIGGSPASKKFLELKQKAAEKVGIEYEIHELSVSNTNQLVEQVTEIAAQNNEGVIIELPLPLGIDIQPILDAVPQEKDVDVLSRRSQDAYFGSASWRNMSILPPAVEAVRIIFEKYNIDISGKKCAVFGHGLLVGKPIAHWLQNQKAEVSIIDEFTENPTQFSREADIIISGVGKANLIRADMVKPGAIVIDFGYENIEGRSVGDVDFESVSEVDGLITPVPGGVGPIVIAAVFRNLMRLNS